jgi:hypothetical protein
VLVAPCGTCHRGSLETAKPGALAVFDLDEKIWHRKMTDEQLRDLGGRVAKMGAIEDLDKGIVELFLRCRLEGECGSQGEDGR